MMQASQQFTYKYVLPVNPDQLCFVSPKVWGHEEWIVNNDKYCGKKLVFKQGYRTSLHFHKIKEETWYVVSGRVIAEVMDEDGTIHKRIMLPGDVQHIKPLVRHRIGGLTDAEVMEFSTFHMEDDSYRIENASAFDCCSV